MASPLQKPGISFFRLSAALRLCVPFLHRANDAPDGAGAMRPIDQPTDDMKSTPERGMPEAARGPHDRMMTFR
jgi:hypothetical protein